MGGGSDKNRSLTPFEIGVIYVSNLWGRMSFRLAILLGVCLQNAGYTLIRKYSTLTENVSSKEILLVAEAMKVIVGTSPLVRLEERRLFPSFILTHISTHHTLRPQNKHSYLFHLDGHREERLVRVPGYRQAALVN
jgi:hypothetical protein